MKKRYNSNKKEVFEFVFYINNNIIVHRYFNVPDYNKNFPYTIEVKDMINDIVGLNNGDLGSLGVIPEFFKNQTIEDTWSNFYQPYYKQEAKDIIAYDPPQKEDNFTFEVKVDKRVIGRGIFSANIFPTNIRYSVDINPIIPEIVDTLVDYMSDFSTVAIGDVYDGY